MIYPSDFASRLFTRAEVAKLTGIDDSTLNYWMREGLLRAAEGGGGKGHHRRFPYHQVNLAALLNQVRGFGVGLPALKQLAARFHEALDYMNALGLDPNDESAWDNLDNVARLRKEYLDQYLNKIPSRERLLWMEYVEARLPEYRRANKRIFKQLSRLFSTMNVQDYFEHDGYWTVIAGVDNTIYVTSHDDPKVFYHKADGSWAMGEPEDAEKHSLSFVGVFVDLLRYETWGEYCRANASEIPPKWVQDEVADLIERGEEDRLERAMRRLPPKWVKALAR